MDPIELSNDAGPGAIGALTANILIGLVLATKYNPVRSSPRRRINTVLIHNYTGYAALVLVFVHPALLLFPNRVEFRVIDLFHPMNTPKQPRINTLGAAAAYLLIVVVVTSYFRFQMGRTWWKRVHFATYALFPLYAVHAILTDPALKDRSIDYLNGEKVYVELCVLAVVLAVVARMRWQARQPAPRTHLVKAGGVVRTRKRNADCGLTPIYRAIYLCSHTKIYRRITCETASGPGMRGLTQATTRVASGDGTPAS